MYYNPAYNGYMQCIVVIIVFLISLVNVYSTSQRILFISSCISFILLLHVLCDTKLNDND